MRLRSSFVLLLVLLLGSLALSAQTTTADIRGFVTDPSGAIVKGATVELRNVDQNLVRTATTNAEGSYVFSLVPIGRYRLTVSAPGFQKYTADNVILNVNDRRTVDVALKVGAADQTVEVKESAVHVQLDNPQAEGLISGTQIRELSVLSRNFVQLVALQPGVTSDMATDQLFVGASNPTGFSNQINISVNGNRPTQNNWLIDGADNMDRGANLTLLNYPSVDAIAEFKVLRSNYLPEHGRSSSGEVSVVTRGGSNDWHGSAYEFFRNDKLNANEAFYKKSELSQGLPNKPSPMRWNDFGFTLGGPIKKDKTFFFYSQEWRKFIIYPTFTSGQLPTAAEMAGTLPFSVCTAYDGSGNCTANGTTITNIDPVAAAYIKDIYSKLPPASGADSSLITANRSVYNYREEMVRIDHNFGQKLQIFGRYTDDDIPTYEPGGLYTGNPLPGVANTQSNAPGRNLSVHATSTFSPTLLNEAGYTFSWGAVLSDPVGTMAKVNSPDIKPTLPYASSSATVPFLGFDYVQGLYGFGSYRDYNKNHTFYDTVSWVTGHHSFKFGGTFNHYTKDENANNDANFYISSDAGCGGTCAWDGTFEQNWANFLIGRVASYSQAQKEFQYLVNQKQFEIFGQDEWRLSSRFTLDYGLRYSLFMAPTYGNDLLSTFDPKLYNAAQAPNVDANGFYTDVVDTSKLTGLIQGGHNSPYGHAVVPTPKLAFAPRLGFAWDPFGNHNTSIRGGYGIFFDSPAINNHENAQESNPSVSATANYFNTSLSNPSGSTPVNYAPPTVFGPNPTNWALPYSQMFNLDIQHQITPTMMIDVGYYGNLGRHLMGVVDVNMPKAGDFQNIPGYCTTASHIHNGVCTFRGLDYQMLNYVRPYKGYDAINLFSPVFTSNYNGLQAQFQKQFSSNSQVVVNYTWSHTLTTASGDYRAAQNTYNIRGDYGNSDFDRRHVLTASYVYTLPWFKTQEGFTGHLAGGWELSGIIYANSGRHYTASASSCSYDRAGLGLCGNTYSGARPDIVGDPQQGAPHTIGEWFNTSAFALVPVDQMRPGNEGRGTIVGPGAVRWDASIFKNTKINERFTTQFRCEMFNALNHLNLGQGAPASAFRSLSRSSGLFGQIANARDPRNIQLALKLIF